MKEEKNEEIKKEEVADKKSEQKIPLREILIQTDGINISVVKIEVSVLELREICRSILEATFKKNA